MHERGYDAHLPSKFLKGQIWWRSIQKCCHHEQVRLMLPAIQSEDNEHGHE